MRRHTRNAILWLCVSFCLLLSSCHSYNPSLFASFDVLNPGPEVRMNPIGSVGPDGRAVDEKGRVLTDGLVVNQAFILWVYELKAEIVKLREKTK